MPARRTNGVRRAAIGSGGPSPVAQRDAREVELVGERRQPLALGELGARSACSSTSTPFSAKVERSARRDPGGASDRRQAVGQGRGSSAASSGRATGQDVDRHHGASAALAEAEAQPAAARGPAPSRSRRRARGGAVRTSLDRLRRRGRAWRRAATTRGRRLKAA